MEAEFTEADEVGEDFATRHPADREEEYPDNDPLTGHPEGVVGVRAAGNGDGRKAGVPQRAWSGCPLFPRDRYGLIRAGVGEPHAIRIQKEVAPGQFAYFNASNAKRHFALTMDPDDIGERWGNGKYVVELYSDANGSRGAERIVRRTITIDDAADEFPDGERKHFPTNGRDPDPSVPDDGSDDYADDYGPPRGRRGRGYGPDGDDYDPRDPRSRDGWRREREPRGTDMAAVLTAASPVLTAWMANQSAAADRAMQMQMEAIRAQQAAQAESSKQFMTMMMAQNKPAPESKITEVLLTHLLTQKQAPAMDPVTAAAQQVAAVDKLRSAFGGGDDGGEGGLMAMLGPILADPQKLQGALAALSSLAGGAPQAPLQGHVQQHAPQSQPQVHVQHGPPLPPDAQLNDGEG